MTGLTPAYAGAALALLVASTAGGAPAPDGTAIAVPKPGQTSLIGDSGKCKKLPGDKRVVAFNLQPSTKVGDLIAWISTVTFDPKQAVVVTDLVENLRDLPTDCDR